MEEGTTTVRAVCTVRANMFVRTLGWQDSGPVKSYRRRLPETRVSLSPVKNTEKIKIKNHNENYADKNRDKRYINK
jgi:hypothetical protein